MSHTWLCQIMSDIVAFSTRIYHHVHFRTILEWKKIPQSDVYTLVIFWYSDGISILALVCMIFWRKGGESFRVSVEFFLFFIWPKNVLGQWNSINNKSTNLLWEEIN